jgi:F0F1-type ATP synthase membrane subunit b/b'
MKTWVLVFLISLGVTSFGLGQEAAKESAQSEQAASAASEHREEEGDPRLAWKWANFVILAGLLGWGISKGLPGFLKARTEEISKGIAEATQFKAQAAAKARDIEERMSRVGLEIEALRPKAMDEMKAEGDRIQRETETFVAKIHQSALAEIESATRQSKAELKSLSAKLAIDLAVQKIRSSGKAGGGLVDRFISDLAKDAITKKGASS